MVARTLSRFSSFLVISLLFLAHPGRAVVSHAASPIPGDGSLLFVENMGQLDARVRFQARAGEQTLWLTGDALWISRTAEPSGVLGLKLSFPDANPQPRVEPFGRQDVHLNYYLGGDPAHWYAGVPVWSGIRYRDLYPGIDLEVYGWDGEWAWRLVANEQRGKPVDQRLDELASHLRVEGAEWSAHENGNLLLNTPLGKLRLPALNMDLARSSVRPQDAPSTLLWSTFIGSSDYDRANAVAVDGSGAPYITGVTFSPAFPTTPGLDTTLNGNNDLFVVKLKPDGSGLLYATLMGGSFNQSGYEEWYSDVGHAVAVDASGSAFLTGFTRSPDFPTTAGAFDTTYNGGETCVDGSSGILACGDAFAARLDLNGQLVYSTFLGGSYLPYVDTGGDDAGYGIAIDAQGHMYVTGFTSSWDFPTTPGAYKRVFAREEYGLNDDVFVAVINPAGQGTADLLYSTYFGGGWEEQGSDIAVDGNGYIYVTGYHDAQIAYIQNLPDWATTPGAFDPGPLVEGKRAFVFKLYPGGQGTADLRYSTLFGPPSGSATVSSTYGESIAVDNTGQVYISGSTLAADMVTTAGAYDRTLGGSWGDAFIARFNLGGQGTADLLYATYLGGSSADCFYGQSDIALDAGGDVYVTGETTSADFPTTPGAYQSARAGSNDAFLVRLHLAGQGANDLVYGTYIGGTQADEGAAVAVSQPGMAYVAGYTDSSGFPITPGASDASWNGDYDAFVLKLWAAPMTTVDVDTFIQAPAQVYGLPLDTASIPLTFGNYGATTASAVMITATLQAGLTYLSDTSGVAPTANGSALVWTLPYTLPFPSEEQFVLTLNLPDAPLGTHLPVTLTIASAGPEALPTNNQIVCEVELVHRLFLPLVLRNH